MIIVFGGAFNPPTIAHKEIYHHVVKHLPCKKFIFLPVSNLYTKRSLASDHHRHKMLELMTEDLSNVRISTMEFDDSDYLGTYQSLIRIQESHPSEEVVFVIGADNLAKLDKWINAEALLNDFRFIVINRNHMDIEKAIKDHPMLTNHIDSFIILPDFDIKISSTSFRENFDKALVCDKVYDYIQTHQLYRG
jgi:nicotinate-nucleotide adenylyltransferase